MNENEKVTEEVKEEEVKLTKEDEKKVLNAIKQAHLDSTKLSPESQKALAEMMEKAKLPIVFNDKDFKMGEQELDVRQLSRSNYRQVQFRMETQKLAYLKALVQGQTDVLRMLMVIADKLGVEDIVKATDDVLDKVDEQEAKKKAQTVLKKPEEVN